MRQLTCARHAAPTLVCAVAACVMAVSAAAAEPTSTREEPAVVTSPAARGETRDGRGEAREQAAPTAPQAAAPPASDASPSPSAAGQQRDAAASRPSGDTDRIELGVTQITGNAELPRVMYVVPWKRAELGDVGGRPAKSLLDELLEPVDREVFRRQNRYYEALQPDAAKKEP